MRLNGRVVVAVAAALASTTWVGGTGAGAASAVSAPTPVVSRLAGADRIGTAVEISQQAYPQPFTSGGSVYLARMDVFADAVAAGTLTDGPVLLVPSCGVAPQVVKDEVARLAPARVVALGGAGAVCDEVLADAAASRPTARLAGADRYLTSLAIAKERVRQGPVSEVYVASGMDSPDAVVGGQLTRGPILLTGTVDRSADYNAFIDSVGPTKVIALGGPGVVTETQLALLHGDKDRLAGASRYETAAAIAFHQFPGVADAVYLARGDVYADAVAAGALTDGPVLLVESCGLTLGARARVAATLPYRVVGLGGEGAVCTAVLDTAASVGVATETRISLAMPDTTGAAMSGQHEIAVGGTGRFIAVTASGVSPKPGIHVVDRAIGSRELVSLDSSGVPIPHGKAMHASISDDGRYVAFQTEVDDPGMQDTNFRTDVYVRDRVSGTTRLVSRSTTGRSPDAGAEWPQISGDGRFILFTSSSGDLVAGDRNLEKDLFVAEVATGRIQLVTSRPDGSSSNAGVVYGSISRTGQFVVFASAATDLLPGYIDGASAYLRDLTTGQVTRVSTKPDGSPVEVAVNSRPDISDDGGVAVFETTAQALPEDADSNAQDLYVKDVTTGALALASGTDVFPDQREFSGAASLTADGGQVAYLTRANDATDPLPGLEPRVLLFDRATGMAEIVAPLTDPAADLWLDSGPVLSADGSVIGFLARPAGGPERSPYLWERLAAR